MRAAANRTSYLWVAARRDPDSDMAFKDWLQTILGPNWVVCRNNAKNRARYPGYSIVSQRRFTALKLEYENQTGLKAP